MLYFGKCFSYIYWDNYTIFILNFVNVVYHTDLRVLKYPGVPGTNFTWSWCVILLMHWIWFANIENFSIYVHQKYWHIFFSCSLFDIKWIWISSYLLFYESLRISIKSLNDFLNNYGILALHLFFTYFF